MKSPVLTIATLKTGGPIEAIWQKQHALPGLRVINSVLIPNLERGTRNL
jgi:hypothetical protein